MNKRQTKNILLIINATILLSSTIITTLGVIFGAGDGQAGTRIIGLNYFKPYTIDSNVLSGIAALCVILTQIKSSKTPRSILTLHLMVTVCLSITILTTALFLAPMSVMQGGSYFKFFSGDMFFFHFINPILSVISFRLLIRKSNKPNAKLALIPTIIYSIVYILMVVTFKKWDDFYNFTFGGNYILIPFVVMIMLGTALGIAKFLLRDYKK